MAVNSTGRHQEARNGREGRTPIGMHGKGALLRPPLHSLLTEVKLIKDGKERAKGKR